MLFSSLLSALAIVPAAFAATRTSPNRIEKRACASPLPSSSTYVYKPKVMIVSMFSSERSIWIEPMQLHYNVTPQVPGLSPLYPDIQCNHAGSVCIITTGESEINAAATISALTLSPQIDTTQTYFLVGGIAGINPYYGTTGTAAWARFAIQVALQYEIDARQIPSNWSTGYWALGTKAPGLVPKASHLYGTEIYELNTNLLARAYGLTKDLVLNDTAAAATYRQKYDYAPANQPPTVVQCDAATSDVYYAGTLLAESFGNYTSLMTNGEAVYCTTAQEDNATLESIARAHLAGLADYGRVLVLRTGSDFDRAPPGVDAYTAFEASQGGFAGATQNIVITLTPVINDILDNWSSVYAAGIAPQVSTYYGNDLGNVRGGPAVAKRSRATRYL